MSSDARPYTEPAAASRARGHTLVAWLAPGLVALVVVLAAAFAWLVYVRVIRADLPLSYDEAAHALFALSIAQDLRTHDAFALAYDIYRQVYWPPLHSVIVGTAFTAFGDRIAVARAVSAVTYALIPIALLAAGRVLYPREDPARGWVTGGVAALLAVATPALIPFASLAFLELPALLAVTLTLLAYFVAERAVERPRRRALVAAGVLLAYFLKTNYGILLVLVLALDAVIDARLSVRRLLSARNAYVVIPIGIVLAAWFAYLPKIVATIQALVNRPAGGVDPWTLEGLLFYPGSLLDFAGSPVMLAVLLAGVVGAWGLRRFPNVRLLLLLFGVQFFLGQVHHTKENRHIYPLLPAMFLMTGVAAARLAHFALGAGSRARPRAGVRGLVAVAGVAFAGLVAVHLWLLAARPFPTAWPRMPGPPGPTRDALLAAVAAAVDRGERVLLVGTFDLRPGPPVMDWELATGRSILAVQHAGATAVVGWDRRVAAALDHAPLPQPIVERVRRVLQRSDAPARVRTVYAGLPYPLDAPSFAASFDETLRLGRIDRVILVTAVWGGARYPLSYFAPALDHPALAADSSRVVVDGWRVRLDEFRVTPDSASRVGERAASPGLR